MGFIGDQMTDDLEEFLKHITHIRTIEDDQEFLDELQKALDVLYEDEDE